MRHWRHALLLLSVLLTGAVKADALHVVEIANFGCPYCYGAERHHDEIARAVEKQGGRFVFAPIAFTSIEEGARERAYYAARSQGKSQEEIVRTALFRLSVDQGMPLESGAQVIEALRQVVPPGEVDLSQLAGDMNRKDARRALTKAVRLAIQVEVGPLPAYLLIKNGEVIQRIDRDAVPSGGRFFKQLIRAIEEHSNE